MHLNYLYLVLTKPSCMPLSCRFALTSFILGITIQSFAQPFFIANNDPKPINKEWILVENMSDNFNQNSINKEKWQTASVGNDWNWIGRPPGLFLEENIVVKDGFLNVTVGVLKKTIKKRGQKFKYYGGIIRSIHPGKPGMYFEAKMKANATEMSSTFWLMTKYNCEKKLETDIQECVGVVSKKAHDWSKEWDHIFHSNAIHRKTPCADKKQLQDLVLLKEKNHSRFFVYAAWWKSPDEIQFFLDGKYTYSIKPEVDWDVPAYIQMAIETYHWNPVPKNGGMVAKGTQEQRTTQYDWVRVWELK